MSLVERQGPSSAKTDPISEAFLLTVGGGGAKVAGAAGKGLWGWLKGALSKPTPNFIGKVGEEAVSAVYNIGGKQKISINGRVRIPDGITNTTLSEVKNVKSLSYTKQLRDFADIALQRGLGYNLYVRPSTKLSGPLQSAIRQGTINLKFIPGVK